MITIVSRKIKLIIKLSHKTVIPREAAVDYHRKGEGLVTETKSVNFKYDKISEKLESVHEWSILRRIAGTEC